ncbi:GH116 family glycosyl-hydrolase [Georgenia alba]|uniref:GH116 family glycosyl-hydrolase n=1 Tax=Georgenia alba TaxID=2233858 RepID=A0ABW2Q7Z4_9MICO
MRHLSHTSGGSVALPLGGIGTGNVAVCADGALRQWQLHNIGNHRGDLPWSFFALRVQRHEPPLNDVRILQAPPADLDRPAPLVTDHEVPAWQRDLLARFGGVRGTTFRGTYPFAAVDYDLDAPVDVRMEAFTPLVPLDVDRSSLPAAMFTFTLTNTGDIPLGVWLGAAMQNPVGLDGTTAPDGVRAAGYGGNTNRVRREDGWTSLVMENAGLDPLAPGAGQAVLTCDTPYTVALPQWVEAGEFLSFLRSRSPYADRPRLDATSYAADHQAGAPVGAVGPSPAGQTWNGGLAAPLRLAPGETATVRYALTWHFPNRYVNFHQFGPPNPQWGPTRFWLGNHYTTRYRDAEGVAARLRTEWEDLERDSRAWTDVLAGSGLGDDAVEHLAAQAAVLRSPTCFRTADGAFFGFEGVNGASTTGHAGDVGGSCPLNCTHVWNYAQALAALFPELERSMRDTELDVLQAPDGSVPHRVISPTYLPQLWGKPIGGPDTPALDGMLGVLLKTYRELRSGAVDLDWLAARWSRLVRLLEHVRAGWDPEGTGVLRGIQPSTHDIDLRGVNTFMGTYWLAALRAVEEMARLRGEDHLAAEVRALFERGSAAYDEQLFTGEYYRQVLEPGEPDEFQWGEGCLSDQLIGQWWAHELDLGHLLPADHVRTALRSVVRHNLRSGFDGFEHTYRVFADRDDTGLLVCSWPTGGRPEVPTRYADEVWTGTEQQVAALCLREGLEDEAWAILEGLWRRYDGRRRNPYNHIECGDHYVRSMSGWSVLHAWTGRAWDAVSGTLSLREPAPGERLPVLTGTGWGYARRRDDGETELVTVGGDPGVRSLEVRAAGEVLAPDHA